MRISCSRCSSFITARCLRPLLSSRFSAAQRQMKALSELFFLSGLSTTGPSSSLDSRFILLLSQVLRGFHSSLSFDDCTPCASPERASSKLPLSIAAHAPPYAFHSGCQHAEAFRKAGVNLFLMADFRHERCTSSQDLRLFSLRCSGDFTTRSLSTDHCTLRESLVHCLVILCCGSYLTSFLLSELLAN